MISASFNRLRFLVAAALLFLAAQRHSLADSATWATNPISGDWNTAANWKPQTVPNSSSDIATFATTNQTEIATSALTEIAGINFEPGADSFTITAGITATQSYNLKLSGSGVVNSSGKLQTFLCGSNGFAAAAFLFYNSSTAGSMTSFGGAGGSNFDFSDSSSAGSATFDLGGGFGDSGIFFFDSSTAENATITTTFGVIDFLDDSTAANANITVSGPSFMELLGSAHGGHVVATCFGGTTQGTNISFAENATAEEGTYTAVGASAAGEFGSFIEFLGSATADRATFIIKGGMGAGLEGTSLDFVDTTTAANATITANGGVDGSDGGVISFQEQSRGGNASISLSGNATLDISTHRAPGVTIGSLAGDGLVLLGLNTLTVGSNNLSTAFSGLIQGSGSLAKIGTGTLTFEGGTTNQYIADTAGLVLVSGSIINLNFTGAPDVIASLVVNGIPQPPGVYGSPKSGAPNPLPEFAGPGTVEVTAGPSPTPTPTATATATATATVTVTPSPTVTPTATPTATGTPTATPTPRPTPTPRFAPTPRPRPTAPPRP